MGISRTDSTRGGTGLYLYCSPQIPAPHDFRWAAAFVSNLIFRGTTARSDYRRGVPISMAWLKRMLGRKAQPTMAWMRGAQVIERTSGYVVGEAPCSYRLLPPYDECQAIECTDRKLIGRIVQHSRSQLPVLKWLQEHAKALQIDEAEALAEISTLEPRRREGSVSDLRNSAARCVRLIADGHVELKLDDIHGRVFAPHVTLNSALRKHLRSPSGEPILSLDIRNCQPLLLTLAFAQYYHPRRDCRFRLLNHEMLARRNPYLWPTLGTIGKSLRAAKCSRPKTVPDHNLQHTVHHIEDFGLPCSCVAWARLASDGVLYESFGEDREAVKEQFILVLFGRRPLGCYEVGRRILRDFPEVAEVINAMKQKNCLVGKDPRPYRYVACLLQLYESSLMIYRCCGRIKREHPQTPVWTIHDSLLTTAAHGEYVRRVIQEEFAGVGIYPTIKETWL